MNFFGVLTAMVEVLSVELQTRTLILHGDDENRRKEKKNSRSTKDTIGSWHFDGRKQIESAHLSIEKTLRRH